MPSWVGLIVLFVNITLALRKPKSGVWLFLVFSFVLPHTQIVGRAVPYDIMGFVPILICIIFVNKLKIHRPNALYILVPLYPALMIFSTWVSAVFYGFSVEPLLLLGPIRFCVLIYMFVETLDNKSIVSAVFVLTIINFAVCILQLLYPQDLVDIFYNLYGQKTHSVLRGYHEAGIFGRPTGTLLSPVNVGVLVLISYSMLLYNILSGDRKVITVVAIILTVLTGVLSLTKTALLGIPIVTFFGFTLNSMIGASLGVSSVYFKKKYVFYGIGVIVLICSIAYYTYTLFMGSEYRHQVTYYLGFILDPFRAFNTRYSGGGTLAETIDVTLQYPFLGLGATRAEGEFLGDSTLIRVAHATGALGITLHSSIYLYITYVLVRSKDILKITVLLAVFLSGFALWIFYTKYGALAISFCIVSYFGDQKLIYNTHNK